MTDLNMFSENVLLVLLIVVEMVMCAQRIKFSSSSSLSLLPFPLFYLYFRDGVGLRINEYVVLRSINCLFIHRLKSTLIAVIADENVDRTYINLKYINSRLKCK